MKLYMIIDMDKFMERMRWKNISNLQIVAMEIETVFLNHEHVESSVYRDHVRLFPGDFFALEEGELDHLIMKYKEQKAIK